MITLITGTPGAGKTLYTISQLLPEFKDRKIFIDGIPDLLIDHELASGEVNKWKSWLPSGAVLVVDECQRIWRTRGTGSQVPEGVAAMETHRHTGNDIVLITQHPNLLDANVRRLVGRHLHVRRLFGWNRAIVYEWDSATDPSKVGNAVKRSFNYPKSAFSLYKSAETHNKRGQALPLPIVFALVALVLIPVLGYYAYSRTMGKPPEVATKPDALTAALAQTVAAPVSRFVANIPENLDLSMLPVDHGNIYSAPLFAPVVPAVVAPVITACISNDTMCKCYSQQATVIWVPEPQCRARVAGSYYDPYQQPRNAVYSMPSALPSALPAVEVVSSL